MTIFLQLLAFTVVAASVHGFVRRDAVDEGCALVRKDCIRSGELFKKSVVCASNGKRFINQCALQLRACDLYFDTGEVLMEERCFWIDTGEKTDEEEEDEDDEDDEEDEEEGSGMEEAKETFTVMEKFYTTKDTMTSPTPNNFMTTGNIYYDYFSSQYGDSLNSLSSDFFFPGIPEEPSEINACSCRGDSICPSCEPSYKKTSGKICGSDGKTYATECEMDNRRCNEEILDLHMVHEGAC